MSKVDGKWWDVAWNPVTGCTPISEGCANCWAKGMASRLRGRAGYPEDEPFRVTLHPDKLDQPLHWKKPRKIFVCDMGDLFHRDVPWAWISKIWKRMWIYAEHDFLVLTKRPYRMGEFLHNHAEYAQFAPENIWLGVTCENQKWADIRIPLLEKIPAAVRFVSFEPLLEEVVAQTRGIDWAIIGCESGPKRRPCKLEWVRNLVYQFKSEGKAVWVKQLSIDGKVSHDMSEFPKELQIREWPKQESEASDEV